MTRNFLAFSMLFSLVFGLLLMPGAAGKLQSYYSGDAIGYSGRVIIGSTDSGDLELFEYDGAGLFRAARIKPHATLADGNASFTDLALRVDGKGRLLVYGVDGKYLYQYDISLPGHPILLNKIKDNSWDWFMGVDAVGDKIITKGTKGLKIWNKDLQVIDSFPLANGYSSYNLNYEGGRVITNLDNDLLYVFDTKFRQYISAIEMENKEDHNRKIYNDGINGAIYLADDKALIKADYSGLIMSSYEFTGPLGYDADGNEMENHLYFSDGIGVVKLNKFTFEPITWAYTGELGAPGGWAMGLKAVNSGQSEKVVVFNGSNILLLDKDLKYLAHANARDEAVRSRDKLFLGIDKNRAAPNSQVALRGGGFGLNENLIITFAGKTYKDRTDDEGRFAAVIRVPDVLPIRTDIKVTGKNSDLSYSIGFKIE